MVSSTSNEAVLVGRWIAGFSQVIRVDDDGAEGVMEPCLPNNQAVVLAASFNRFRSRGGALAVVRAMRLPCLARDPSCKSR
jgi:hypothetical protein